MKKWEYDSTWERIVTKGKDGAQVVIVELSGDPDELRTMGPVLVEKLNRLRCDIANREAVWEEKCQNWSWNLNPQEGTGFIDSIVRPEKNP